MIKQDKSAYGAKHIWFITFLERTNKEYEHQKATIVYFVALSVGFFLCVGAFSRKRAVKEKKSTPAIRATVRTFSGNGDPLNVSP